MREIEFRGYDPDTRRWYYGQYVREEQSTGYAMGYDWDKHERENVKHFIYFTLSGDWGMPTSKHRASVDPASVGQFVGERDTTGKKIYEGDIITLGDDTAIVKYEYLEFIAMSIEPNVHGNVSTWCNILNQSAKVIDNIYEKETR